MCPVRALTPQWPAGVSAWSGGVYRGADCCGDAALLRRGLSQRRMDNRLGRRRAARLAGGLCHYSYRWQRSAGDRPDAGGGMDLGRWAHTSPHPLGGAAESCGKHDSSHATARRDHRWCGRAGELPHFRGAHWARSASVRARALLDSRRAARRAQHWPRAAAGARTHDPSRAGG